jgi:hypothetical protein
VRDDRAVVHGRLTIAASTPAVPEVGIELLDHL